VYPQVLPTIRIGGQLTKAVYQYTLQDADLQSSTTGRRFSRPAAQLPGLQDVNTDLQITSRRSRSISTATRPRPSA